MPAPAHRSGSIPPERRRLVVLVTAGCMVAFVAGCLLINLFMGSPVEWFWIVVGAVFLTAMILTYLWVRLSD